MFQSCLLNKTISLRSEILKAHTYLDHIQNITLILVLSCSPDQSEIKPFIWCWAFRNIYYDSESFMFILVETLLPNDRALESHFAKKKKKSHLTSAQLMNHP